MYKTTTLLNTALVLLIFGLTACSAGEYLTDRFEKEAEDRTKGAADETVERSFDAAENTVRCAVGDDKCIEQAKAQGKPVAVTDEEGNVVKEIPGDEGSASIENANTNYDFKPGDRVLFAEDFSNDNVGDFPRRLEFVSGSWEVVEWQGRRFLRNTSNRCAFKVPLHETLPERFTIEFDAHFRHGNQQLAVATVEPERNRVQHLEDRNFFHFTNAKSGVDVSGDGVEALRRMDDPFAKGVVRARIMVDGSHAKVYLGKQRVANVPNAKLPRSNMIWFENTYFADAEHPIYIDNIRIAAGGRDLYSTLEAEGRVVVQDILFDTGKANIQSASAEALKQIAKLLDNHYDLELLIEGHTDDTGSFETNMKLSKERAEAVKTYLVEQLGIDASRLKTNGLGSTRPTASNDTKEGRAENRRVELVKL